MNKLLLALSLFVVVSCSSSKFPPKVFNLHTHMGKSTVALVTKDDDGIHKPYCTGTFISERLILTAAHCVEHKVPDGTDSPIGLALNYIVEDEVTGIGQEPSAVHLATAIKVDHDHDLALLEAVSLIPDHEMAHLARTSPPIGDKVLITGQAHGLYWTYIEGSVSNYRAYVPGDDRKSSYLQIDSHMFFGDSGAGVFNTDGEIVAVAEAIMPSIPGVGWCICLRNVKDFLKS